MNEHAKNSNEENLNINADENLSGTEHLNDPIGESALDGLQSELDESRDKYLRLAAEFDNFRKRTAKERLELFQTAGKDIISDLLEVLDDIDRAGPQIEKMANNTGAEGVLLIFNKFRNILQSRGLKVMEAVGKEFDPELHDAISIIAVPEENLKGKVLDEINKGYYLNDKIIRHAKVVVGK